MLTHDSGHCQITILSPDDLRDRSKRINPLDLILDDFKITHEAKLESYYILYVAENGVIRVLKNRWTVETLIDNIDFESRSILKKILDTPVVLPLLLGIDPEFDKMIESTLKGVPV